MNDHNLPASPEADGPGRRPPAGSRNDALRDDPGARTQRAALDPVYEEEHPVRPDIDLLAYWRVVSKRRWLVLGVLGLVALATLLLTMMVTPIYRATAVLQIDNEEQQVVKVGGVTSQASTYDPQFQQTQYELLRSRALAERVAEELDVAGMSAGDQSAWRRRAANRQGAEPVGSGASADTALKQGIAIIQAGLTVEPVRNSRLVRVNFDSPSPERSAQVVNALVDGFMASGLERRFGASSYAKTYLEDQLKSVKAKLEQSERELAAFAQKENLVSTGEGRSLAGQNVAELGSALATAQEQRIRAQARLRQAQATSGAALPADMLATSIVPALQQQRALVQAEYRQKLPVFTPDYPEMLQLKEQIAELDRQLSSELSNIRASIRAEYDAAASQESLLTAKLDSLRNQALDVDVRSIEYNILKREVDTNRQLYDGLLQRYKEVGVAGDVRSNNISVIDRAQVPTSRFKPDLELNLAIGLLLGLSLGVGAAFLLEYLDDTVKTPADIEDRLKLTVLGIVPKLTRQTPVEAVRDRRSAFSESYLSVRTALEFSTDSGVPQILLVSSAGAGEGKTTSALTLARNFAQMGKRTLLIDGDLRNPSLHKLLEMRTDSGLSNLLAGSGSGIGGGAGTLAEVARDTDEELLSVILAGPLPPNPAELLSGPRLGSLLAEASQRYDLVIVDGPPVIGLADAPILANAADATIMVVQSGKTRVATAQAAVKRLRAARARVLGGLLTQFDSKVAGYGDTYLYEDYYAYGNPAKPVKG